MISQRLNATSRCAASSEAVPLRSDFWTPSLVSEQVQKVLGIDDSQRPAAVTPDDQQRLLVAMPGGLVVPVVQGGDASPGLNLRAVGERLLGSTEMRMSAPLALIEQERTSSGVKLGKKLRIMLTIIC
jgi:hypothetical protein